MLNAVGIKTIDQSSPLYKNLEGAKEIDIVYSGLEEIMTNAVKKHFEFSQKHSINIRDAALMAAIQDIYQDYLVNGITIG